MDRFQFKSLQSSGFAPAYLSLRPSSHLPESRHRLGSVTSPVRQYRSLRLSQNSVFCDAAKFGKASVVSRDLRHRGAAASDSKRTVAQPKIDRQQTFCAEFLLGGYDLLLAPPRGTVNVSSRLWLPLPERAGQQRKPLTLSVRFCKGSSHARFPRCQSYGENPT